MELVQIEKVYLPCFASKGVKLVVSSVERLVVRLADQMADEWVEIWAELTVALMGV